MELSWEELRKKALQEGKVLVLVKGKVYDFTENRSWVNGQHMGRHQAGDDLSQAILKSPHGERVLKRFQAIVDLSKE